MDVVLDTNIFQQDLSLRTSRVSLLLDYLRRTDSKVTLPQIVLEELVANYGREVSDKVERYLQSKKNLEKILPGLVVHEELPSLADTVEEYRKRLFSTLGITSDDIVSYKPEYLNDVLMRAVQRRKPCSRTGEEIRDAVLWLSVKEVARQDGDNRVVFITANQREFADETDSTSLHPDLLEEAKQEDLNIIFYKSLDDFLKAVATKIDYINAVWLNEHLDVKEAESDALLLLESDQIEDLKDWALKRGLSLNGNIIPTEVQLSLKDYLIYERINGELLVDVFYEGFVETVFDEVSIFNPYEFVTGTQSLIQNAVFKPAVEVTVEAVVVSESEGIRHVVTVEVEVEK